MEILSPALLSLHRLTVGVPGLGAKLISIYGSANSVLREFDHRLTPVPEGIQRKLRLVADSKEHLDAVERDLAWQERTGCGICSQQDLRYPALLRQINDPPLVLFTWGDETCLEQDQIAVVGSRKVTPQGAAIAEQFASELSASGFAITSGMALGIDAAAHRGALKVGGKTLAVQGIGAGDFYPRRHERLGREIAANGCIITEYPTGFDARAHHFPQRNRIVTGLSRGTLVVEAALGSGSLISARLAMEQGKEVFAVPGSIQMKQSEGCHALIRQGAKLAANLADILEEFPDFQLKRHRRVVQLDEREQMIVDALEQFPCHANQLHEITLIGISELMALLIKLEIQGEIESCDQGYRLKQFV